MAVIYQKYKMVSTNDKVNGKFYARVKVLETVDLEGLAAHMAAHNSGFSKGQIYGVLTQMVDCILEHLKDSKAVKIPNLAIFKPVIKSTGADSFEAFSPSQNIVNVRLRAQGTGQFANPGFKNSVSLQEDSIYGVDISGSGSGSGGGSENEVV